MSITFYVIMALIVAVTVFMVTPIGRDWLKGIRSNIWYVLGGLNYMLDQIVTQLQDIPWDAYLEPVEALVCLVTMNVLGAVFTAMKATKK